MNRERWIVEGCFRITKTEFRAGPVFLRRGDRIKAYLLMCFLALILCKYLEKKVNSGRTHFTVGKIIGTLRGMNFVSVAGEGYMPIYTRTDVSNHLHASEGFRSDTQIVSKQRMRGIISSTKKK